MEDHATQGRQTRRQALIRGTGAALLLAALPATAVFADTTSSSTSSTSSTGTSSTSSGSTTSTSSTASTTSTSSTASTSTSSSTSSTVSAPAVTHDNRYFSQTGYRIDNDTTWDYFNRRGGLTTFGYPVSRTFKLQGFTVQFFQRRVVQLGPNGQARLLNTLDPGLLPYTSFNGSNFPGVEASLVTSAPNPTDQPAVLAWIKQHAPDSFNGQPVNYYQTFINTVSAAVAFPNGGAASLLPGIDLEMWGVPTSAPQVDATNSNFIYLRWQRGIMHYDATKQATQGILLADYLKAILTGQNLPGDLNQEAQNSPLYKQYDPSQANWVHNASLLPGTDLTYAFEQG